MATQWSATFLSIIVVGFLFIFFIMSQVDRRKEEYACRFHIFAVVTAQDYLRIYRINVIEQVGKQIKMLLK